MVGQRHRTLESGVDVSAMVVVIGGGGDGDDVHVHIAACGCGIDLDGDNDASRHFLYKDLRQDQVQVDFPPKISLFLR